jgi:hypothetical protein
MGARPPRTYVTQQQVEDALAARRDIHVENRGSLVLLRPQTRCGRRWLAEHVGGSKPYLLLPRHAADALAGAREDGLKVRQ